MRDYDFDHDHNKKLRNRINNHHVQDESHDIQARKGLLSHKLYKETIDDDEVPVRISNMSQSLHVFSKQNIQLSTLPS